MGLDRRRFLAGLTGLAAGGAPTTLGLAQDATPAASSSRDADADFAILQRDFLVGIGIAGLEYGTKADTLPGIPGRQYFLPQDRLNYLASRGIRSIRLPFRWERVQPQMFGPLDRAYLGTLREALIHAARNRQKLLLDPHNYETILVDGTPQRLGTPELPASALADLWRRLAGELSDHHDALMGFDLLNEPSAKTVASETAWVEAAQSAIEAIREIDQRTFVFVEGWQHASPFTWAATNPNLHRVVDPADRLVISMHQYFDAGNKHRGTYNSSDGSFAGEGGDLGDDLKFLGNFTTWLREHGRRGHVGEFGAPNTPDWLPTMNQFMDTLISEKIPFHAWGAFPVGSNYITQLMRAPDGSDRLQATTVFSKLPQRDDRRP
ncbi:glycoside hydrolase family 5 protein [Aureimonas jatrophae]|uniref:Cellulase family 5 n=1 Tax=Aureimonas jatrophae TaxID=1166073 RepID=A0A1H0JR26_9HYPH|nr:cellulase family glycosylhydrolase [Aureimonas jatrophae]MBB3951289.1 endoglucanase [Aureimonas jatrophae]SDO45952.1 Cellulase family 5 [Aureimonas jatrophae]